MRFRIRLVGQFNLKHFRACTFSKNVVAVVGIYVGSFMSLVID